MEKRISKIRGFTIIEIMTTLLVLAVLLAIGIPSFESFITTQRIRTSTSDFIGDIALARAKAIETSRLVVMARATGTGTCTLPSGGSGPIGTSWADGWCIFVDINNNTNYDFVAPPSPSHEEVIKVQSGVSRGVSVAPVGTGATNDFANRIVFRPDGRILRPIRNLDTVDGISFSSGGKSRIVTLGLDGRTALIIN